MFRRTSNSGHEIEWSPENEQKAIEALAAVDGTGVTSESDLPSDGLVDLDGQPDVQARVREKYQDLTA